MDGEKVIKALECCTAYYIDNDLTGHERCPYNGRNDGDGCNKLYADALALLKEHEAVEPKTIPEELKQRMWNALYAEEDKLEEKYVGTKEHNSWFLIYRPWLQEGFNLAIKAIADWEGR